MNSKKLTLSLFILSTAAVLTNANAGPTSVIKGDTPSGKQQVKLQVNEVCPVYGFDQGSDQPFIKGSDNGEFTFTVPSFYPICNNASSYPQIKLTSSNGSTSDGSRLRLHKALTASDPDAYIKYKVILNGTQLDFAKDVSIPTNSSNKMVLSRVLAGDTSSSTYSDTIN